MFKCILPDCSHYVPENLAVGRTTLCWSCGKGYEIKPKDVRYFKIVCADCKGKRVNNPAIKARIEEKRRELEESKIERQEAFDILEMMQEEMGMGEFLK